MYWYSKHLCSVTWGSISQSRFVYQVWCSGIQDIYSWFTGGSIGQSRFICQFLCTGIQGISALLPEGSISQSRFVCQVWCSGIQGIYFQFGGGSICQSMFVYQVLCTGVQGIYAVLMGIHQPKKVCLLNLSSFTFHALLHRRPFHITYKRPNNHKCSYSCSKYQWLQFI